MISKVLTTSDEAFVLLILKVYFDDDIDLGIEGYNSEENYITTGGWQTRGIKLYNTMYNLVSENRNQYKSSFDEQFMILYNKNIIKNPQKEVMIVFHKHLMICNDLQTF